MVRGELLVTARDDVDRHCFDKAVQADPDWLVPLEIALIYLHTSSPARPCSAPPGGREMARTASMPG